MDDGGAVVVARTQPRMLQCGGDDGGPPGGSGGQVSCYCYCSLLASDCATQLQRSLGTDPHSSMSRMGPRSGLVRSRTAGRRDMSSAGDR